MRYLIVLLLAGCSTTHTMTLYPRDGGSVASGVLDTGAWSMEVSLDGERYTGSYMGAASSSFGTAGTFGAQPVAVMGATKSVTNQYSGLLASESGKTIRCEFIGEKRVGGNGACITGAGKTYDLLLKPQ